MIDPEELYAELEEVAEDDEETDATEEETIFKQEVEKERKRLETDEGKKQLDNAQRRFWNRGLDFPMLNVRDRSRVMKLVCQGCGKGESMFCVRKWVAPAGPALFFGSSEVKSGLTKSRQLGPQSHLVVDVDVSRCWCGWWAGGRCYEDAEHKTLCSEDRMWKCAEVHAARRMVKEDANVFCECVNPVDPDLQPTFPRKTTFTMVAESEKPA